MNQRPFISTQLNIFDDNRCIFSSASIGGQPVMISQEQNRKICDSMITAIASNQRPANSSYCAGPPSTICSNQNQIWPSPLQAQRQGVPGGVVFNFGQPNYCCPPSCIPSVYNPPPPPAPQIMQMQYQTPQSICVDYGRYGMEALAFQQKCRQQCQGFTYDKQVGTSGQAIFSKCDTCCCGVQSAALNAEQKEQLFHRIDEGASKSKLKDTACATDNDKKCVCFPKPDPNKFGSAKALVIGERKERCCKDYDIVEKATKEADAEAYLCCDCLDKWKKENEKQRPSCLKKKTDLSAEKQTGPKEVSISLNRNVLEIIEAKQTVTDPNKLRIKSEENDKQLKATNEYNVEEMAPKYTSAKPKKGFVIESSQPAKVVSEFENSKQNLIELQQLFQMNVKDVVSCLDQGIELFSKFSEIEGKILDEKVKDRIKSNMNDDVEIAKSLRIGTHSKMSKFEETCREISGDQDQLDTSTIMKTQTNIIPSKFDKNLYNKKKTDSISKNQLRKQSDSSDPEMNVEDVTREEKVKSSNSNNLIQPKIEQVKSRNEKASNEQSIVISNQNLNKQNLSILETTKPSDEDSSSEFRSDSGERREEEDEEYSSNMENNPRNSKIIKGESGHEEQINEMRNEEGQSAGKKTMKNNFDMESSEALTSYQNEAQTSVENVERLGDPNIIKKPDKVNQTSEQSTSGPQTSEDLTDGEEAEIFESERDNQTVEAAETEKNISDENNVESEGKTSCECNSEDDKNCEGRQRANFRTCKCDSNLISKFRGILTSVYSNTVERAGHFLSYITNGSSSCAPTAPPYFENPSIITNRYGCHSDCYHSRIRRYVSDLNRPICCSRISTNRFCGRTCYDSDRNLWYSCCPGSPDDKKNVKITFRETSERRIIRFQDNCSNTRYHVVYE